MDVCRKLAPEDCACDWDNPGLPAGRSDKGVKKIYITLDATDKVIETAQALGADMLLTRHPLIFKATKKANDQNFITRRLVKLIQVDISYYAMHTSFDTAPGCIADLAAERLGLAGCVPLEALGEMSDPEGAVSYGVDKSGFLKEEMTIRELVACVKDVFGLPFALVYGDELMDQRVSRISVCPGVGGSEIEGALAWGAQILVTGDIGHHQGIGAAARGMAIIDGGHYDLEHIFTPYMAEFLGKNLGGQVELEQAPPQWPAMIV